MLAGDTIIAEMELPDARVRLIHPRPARRFHETYEGKRHLFAMYRLAGTDAVGRYPEMGQREFSPIGRAFFRPAGHRLECQGQATEASALHCELDDRLLDRSGLSTRHWTACELDKALDVRTAQMAGYQSRIISEIVRPGFGSDTVVDSLLAIILTDLSRQIASPEVRDNQRSDLREQMFRRIVERICDTDTVMPRVSELASMADIGERHLLRLFRQRMGMSLADFVRDVRLEKARHLLASTDTPIKQVAYRLGFSSNSTFASSFRRETGTSPAAFRRQSRLAHLLGGGVSVRANNSR